MCKEGRDVSNTIVDGSDGDKPKTMVYSYQAPDFETKSENGETMVLEHRTAFQGRIDSPRLYAQKVRPLLINAYGPHGVSEFSSPCTAPYKGSSPGWL